MTATWLPSDEPFFREWLARSGSSRRSLARALGLAERLQVLPSRLPPILTVVGSKGKGTAVAHATSVLAASGLRVGTVTSPPFRTNRERIRIDGTAMSSDQYQDIADMLDEAIDTMPASDLEYLSPTGAYTIMAVAFLSRSQVDVLVLEEGLGGRSDEISLFPAKVVVVTPIFEEHLGLIGNSLREITDDLLGVISNETMRVFSTEQMDLVELMIGGRGKNPSPSELMPHLRREISGTVPGLGGDNAATGAVAGMWLANELGRQISTRDALGAVGRVRLPGRLSIHPPFARRRGTWIADAAISPIGVREALRWIEARFGRPDLVMACFPDSKDVAGCLAVLRPYNTLSVVVGEGYLTFPIGGDASPSLQVATALKSADLIHGTILCVGTISFIAEVLEHVDAATEEWWVD